MVFCGCILGKKIARAREEEVWDQRAAGHRAESIPWCQDGTLDWGV